MIAINIGKRYFSSNWFPTLLVLIVVPAMCRLGYWQFERAQEKIALQEQFERHINTTALDFFEITGDLKSMRYQTIHMKGVYDAQHQFILDNLPHERQVGYGIITPFILSSGETLLVQRGWQPRALNRQKLPNVTVAENTRSIKGKINFPGKAFGLGPMSLESGWPLRIQYIDYVSMSERLGRDVLPMIIMLDDEQSDGYVRNWQFIAQNPNKNYSYMFQWLAMAITVVILYISLNLHKREKNG